MTTATILPSLNALGEEHLRQLIRAQVQGTQRPQAKHSDSAGEIPL